MNKKILFFIPIVIGISFSLLVSSAWKDEDKHTADEIINDYITAMGGADKLASIHTIYMEGEINYNGTKRQTKKWIVDQKAMRSEMTFNGITSFTIVRKDSGWNYSPNRGRRKPEPLTANSIAMNRPNLDIAGPLVNYKAKGYKVKYEGTDEIEGTEAFKIEEILNDSLTKTFYMDPDSHFIMRVRTKSSMGGRVITSSTEYSDYNKTPDGYTFPMETGNIKYTVVKVNITIDDKLFKPIVK